MEQIKTTIPPINTELSYDELIQLKADAYNGQPGKLAGYDCKICRNKGYVAKTVEGDVVLAECRCFKTRDTLRRIKESGLEDLLRTCTFRSYECSEAWQQQLKDAAIRFAETGKGWLFMGGQSGCGKTHLCTAVVGSFIKQGKSARYLVWREDSPRLKALVNDREYAAVIDDFKKSDVLYIDDLFKQSDVKDADVKLAFELIDYRARNHLTTIISSERTLDELIGVDEALAGRIIQMSAGFQSVIPKDRSKNYRLRKE